MQEGMQSKWKGKSPRIKALSFIQEHLLCLLCSLYISHLLGDCEWHFNDPCHPGRDIFLLYLLRLQQTRAVVQSVSSG